MPMKPIIGDFPGLEISEYLKLLATMDQGFQEPNWRVPPPEKRKLKRTESVTMQSYSPKIISENR